MNSCYGCAYLVQSLVGNSCIRYDPREEGGARLDDIPEPLYEDCYETGEMAGGGWGLIRGPIARDPRENPQPSDGISRLLATALQGCIIREVTRAHGGGFVFFRRDNGHVAKHQIVSLGQWRRWAKKAEVFMAAGVELAAPSPHAGRDRMEGL